MISQGIDIAQTKNIIIRVFPAHGRIKLEEIISFVFSRKEKLELDRS